jgi:hypothetical protein
MYFIRTPKKKNKFLIIISLIDVFFHEELTNTNSIIKSKNNIEKVRRSIKTKQATLIVVLWKMLYKHSEDKKSLSIVCIDSIEIID